MQVRVFIFILLTFVIAGCFGGGAQDPVSGGPVTLPPATIDNNPASPEDELPIISIPSPSPTAGGGDSGGGTEGGGVGGGGAVGPIVRARIPKVSPVASPRPLMNYLGPSD